MEDEIGALSRPSLRQNSSAEKSLIEVQLIKQECDLSHKYWRV